MYDALSHVHHGDYTPIWRGVIETKTFGYNIYDEPCFLTDYTPIWRAGEVVPSNIPKPYILTVYDGDDIDDFLDF